jgi:hypothetical protein
VEPRFANVASYVEAETLTIVVAGRPRLGDGVDASLGETMGEAGHGSFLRRMAT